MSLLFVETGSTGAERRLLSSHGGDTAEGKAHLTQITTFLHLSGSPQLTGKKTPAPSLSREPLR